LKQVSILEFYSNVISEVRSENKFILGKNQTKKTIIFLCHNMI